jgi:hypothetical protein
MKRNQMLQDVLRFIDTQGLRADLAEYLATETHFDVYDNPPPVRFAAVLEALGERLTAEQKNQTADTLGLSTDQLEEVLNHAQIFTKEGLRTMRLGDGEYEMKGNEISILLRNTRILLERTDIGIQVSILPRERIHTPLFEREFSFADLRQFGKVEEAGSMVKKS